MLQVQITLQLEVEKQRNQDKMMHQEYLNSFEAYYNASRSNSLQFNNVHKQLGSMRVLLEKI
jgi:hypothetical protein